LTDAILNFLVLPKNLVIKKMKKMKKIYAVATVFTLLLLLSASLLNAQILAASYPFNGNANDASGNGSNGTVNGATLAADRFGNTNSAYNFNGINDYIEAAADNLPAGNSTISLWFNADNGSISSNKPGVLGYGGNTGGCPGNSQILIINIGGAGTYSTQAHCLNNYADYTYSVAPENNWYNWVITRSGTTIKIFINGVLVSTANTATQPVLVTGKKLSIGAIVDPAGNANYSAGNVGHFKGKIDDIKIYSTALTDAQVFDAYVNDVKKPGSGNAMLFDNTLKQVVDVGNGFDQPGSFSFETWVKRTNTNTTDLNAQTFMASQQNNGWSIGINQSAPADRIYISKVGVSQVLSFSLITDTKWHHVAVTLNAAAQQVIFYIDGVADAPVPYNPGGFNSGNTNYRIGGRNNGVNFENNLNGSLDEVRVWNGIVLTQTEIRDWMCKKINSSHPEFANLQGYFRLDEGAGTMTGGYNAKFGTLINTPSWQTSGAAIGDAAAYDYANAVKTANISHTSGENFSVTSTSGSPAGIQVYRVDEQPNTLTGATGVGVNNKYFGVFQAGGTAPQYTAVYNYSGSPYVTPAIESQLRLNKRSDNAATSWALLPDAANEPANTITVTGQSTEYILGSIGVPLPVSLLNFDAHKTAGSVSVQWATTNQTDLANFEVQKSGNGTYFNTIATVLPQPGTALTSYAVNDNQPSAGDNYYRLKMVDKDGRFTYSNIIKINFSNAAPVLLQPNPARDFVTAKGLDGWQQIQLLDMAGRVQIQKTIHNNIEQLSVANLARGVYTVRLVKEGETVSLKMIKQ
jgi:hypothetical protein